MKPQLTADGLRKEARTFGEIQSARAEARLYGITDGKAVGTYFEHRFHEYLGKRYTYGFGSSARGIDFPDLEIDMKVTSIKQPQSSCPFKSARQKIYGLGYSLLVFVYSKTDYEETRSGKLVILHTVFVEKDRTADYQTTTGILKIIENDGNEDDLMAFLQERLLPVDDIQASEIARELIEHPPKVGYLTMSNALQWRLQYRRVIEEAGNIDGIMRIR